MALDFQSAAQVGDGASTHVKKGVFVEEIEIVSAQARYNDHQIADADRVRLGFEGERPSWDTRHDICLDIGYQPLGRDLSFTPTLTLAGSFKWEQVGDGSRRVVGWNPFQSGKRGAEEIGQALAALGIAGSVTDQGTLPEDVLRQMVGKRALVVSYRSTKGKEADPDGRGKIKRMNALYAPKDGEDLDEARLRLADAFLSTYAMRGYPRDYDAEAAGSGDGLPSGGDGFAASDLPDGTSAQGSPFDAFTPDDDLPF